MIIENLTRADFVCNLDTRWQLVTDTVMGGRSNADLHYDDVAGQRCLRLRGEVSLENNGGFLQAAIDLSPITLLDVSSFEGLRLLVWGNDEDYNVHLRTSDLTAPWQSYRMTFNASSNWTEVILPFKSFHPHRTSIPLDLTQLCRLGLVAIGREFRADLCWRSIELF